MNETSAPPEYNRINLDYRKPIPRPKVRGKVIDFHTHLLSARHAPDWFAAADHFGIDVFASMLQLEEVLSLHRDYGHRLIYIAVPSWYQTPADPDHWRPPAEDLVPKVSA